MIYIISCCYYLCILRVCADTERGAKAAIIVLIAPATTTIVANMTRAAAVALALFFLLLRYVSLSSAKTMDKRIFAY
jgi:hypothetical protein